ncbi:MAG: hypothetical protein GOVbin703_116 [Prokaryotic dsDNA virus sp.]|nr:MAG: hypothetical protein GOVbin703_116 [Prokaryotic dsDNA virus sp.]|tara:strand:+ start:29861 stop:31405 length:1545 start_codon:yes stop_codon:yes gene_type:complete
MAGRRKSRRRRAVDYNKPMRNRHNKKRYELKEKILNQVDKKFEESLDNPVTLSEEQIDNIVEAIVRTGQATDTNEPFVKDIIPLGSNNDKSKKLFHRRKYYKDYAWPKPAQSQNIMDEDIPDDNSKYQGNARKIFAPFQFEDLMYNKTFYGRLDTNNYSVYPINKFLKGVRGTEDKVMLLDFVADAANGMIRKIETLKETGKMSNTSTYYEFKVKRGFTDFVSDHHTTMKAFFDTFVITWANDPRRFTRIIDFDSFCREFTYFLGLVLPKFPLSRTNLLLRKTTSPMTTGIMFEISKAKHDQDKKKYNNFILDDHFLQIQSIANGFGFMVDKNAPWRFIADLESIPMKKRMENYGFMNLQQMFDRRFYKCHLYEANSIREYFLSFYDSFVEAYPYYTKVERCTDHTSKAKLLYRTQRQRNPFTDRKLLEYYYFLRAKEARMDWQQETFDIEVQTAQSIFNEYGFIAALNYVNDKTSLIVGRGANFGNKIKNQDGKRIIYNHQPSYKRSNFTMTF